MKNTRNVYTDRSPIRNDAEYALVERAWNYQRANLLHPPPRWDLKTNHQIVNGMIRMISRLEKQMKEYKSA